MLFIWTNMYSKTLKSILLKAKFSKELAFQEWSSYLIIVIVPKPVDWVSGYMYETLKEVLDVIAENNIQINRISIK